LALPSETTYTQKGLSLARGLDGMGLSLVKEIEALYTRKRRGGYYQAL